MANTEVKSKIITVNHPAYILFSAFSDLRNFLMGVPADKKEDIKATEDTIEGTVKGFNMGVQVVERIPYSKVLLKELGASPFPFNIILNFNAVETNKTEFQIELKAELSFFIKTMIGGKLQEIVDQIATQLGDAMNGNLDPSKFDPNNFNFDNFNNSPNNYDA